MPANSQPPDFQPLRAFPDAREIEIVDQTRLPRERITLRMRSVSEVAHAIAAMQVRGAPLIGATAAYGLALALSADATDESLKTASDLLLATRPTAVNLRWALERVRHRVASLPPPLRADAAWDEADAIAAEDIRTNRAIGDHGVRLIESIVRLVGRPVEIMTHCNAGALATLGWGTATSLIYLAHDSGIPLHVWVSETRPRLQGAKLTAWELRERGVPHTLIVDAASASLMYRHRVDLVLVGADRVAANGDLCNKIGTYEKALAAHANGVPIYAAVPSTTIDWSLSDGEGIPIEERDASEVLCSDGVIPIAPEDTRVFNPGFDITPAHLLTGLITERGVCAATSDALAAMFPDRSQ